MPVPAYTPSEAQSRETFLALMWSLSYPGRVYSLPSNGHALALIGITLLDLETSYFTPDVVLAESLAQTGARPQLPEAADYHFYPILDAVHLDTLHQCHVGSLLYPDGAATLVVGCQIGRGAAYVLHGPGILGQQMIRVGGLPAEFWKLRDAVCRYPLGWDVYFVDGQQIIGLPRGVTVTPASDS